MSSEIVDLWDANTIVEYLIYLLLIEQLGLRHRDGHLLLLFPVFGVRILQVLYFHGKCEVIDVDGFRANFAILLRLGNRLQIDTGPDFSEAT